MKQYTIYRKMIEKCDVVAGNQEDAADWCYNQGKWSFHECEPDDYVEEINVSLGKALNDLLSQHGFFGSTLRWNDQTTAYKENMEKVARVLALADVGRTGDVVQTLDRVKEGEEKWTGS